MSENEITVDYIIDATHLTWVEENLINELLDFIAAKTGAIVEIEGNKILIGFEGEKLSKRNIRTYIKRFLYKYELLDRLRVISSGEDEYTIHKRKYVDVRNL
ncbi:MAG: hypothetical protein EU549_01840 [Promethearchaeota archaeon]|nr:MAG: hypothetical protein EU549_01840 [Candidatus Lokiarchaeota archaeon]